MSKRLREILTNIDSFRDRAEGYEKEPVDVEEVSEFQRKFREQVYEEFDEEHRNLLKRLVSLRKIGFFGQNVFLAPMCTDNTWWENWCHEAFVNFLFDPELGLTDEQRAKIVAYYHGLRSLRWTLWHNWTVQIIRAKLGLLAYTQDRPSLMKFFQKHLHYDILNRATEKDIPTRNKYIEHLDKLVKMARDAERNRTIE